MTEGFLMEDVQEGDCSIPWWNKRLCR